MEDHFEPLKEKCQYEGNCKSFNRYCSDCKNNPDNKPIGTHTVFDMPCFRLFSDDLIEWVQKR